MKRGTLLITTLLFISTMATANELRTWTSTVGTTIEAKFVKEQFGTVHLETADGSVKKIKISKLSDQDRKLVAELTDPFAAKRAAKAKAAAEVPKAPDAIYELFGDELRNSRKKKVPVDALANKTIGIYFSAHWCPPCRAFTPKLVDFHNEMTRQGKSFEVVFVSSDNNSSSMYSYMKEVDMPWLALPFGDDHKQVLTKKYNVRGIPKFVIIDADGNLITENGRGDVTNHGDAAFDRWN